MSKKSQAKRVFHGWLNTDGYQEGADGAAAVIDVVWGDGTAERWYEEWGTARPPQLLRKMVNKEPVRPEPEGPPKVNIARSPNGLGLG